MRDLEPLKNAIIQFGTAIHNPSADIHSAYQELIKQVKAFNLTADNQLAAMELIACLKKHTANKNKLAPHILDIFNDHGFDRGNASPQKLPTYENLSYDKLIISDEEFERLLDEFSEPVPENAPKNETNQTRKQKKPTHLKEVDTQRHHGTNGNGYSPNFYKSNETTGQENYLQQTLTNHRTPI